MDIALEGFWIPEFRTFRDEFVRVPDSSDRRRVNVLLGRNGSGKSSLLEALHRLGNSQGSDQNWSRDAVAAYRVGAHFTGHETWTGPPVMQMMGLLETLSHEALLEVTVEDYLKGDARNHHLCQEFVDSAGVMAPTEEVLTLLEDPAPEFRQRFFDIFAGPLEDVETDTNGTDCGSSGFSLEQWLVAVAALRPSDLETSQEHSHTWESRYESHARFGVENLGWDYRGSLRNEAVAQTGTFDLDPKQVQRRFLLRVVNWVEEVSTVLGERNAVDLIRQFLTRPLVLIGTAARQSGAYFPAFVGLGLLREDVGEEVVKTLEAFVSEESPSDSHLVHQFVEAWKSGSRVIRIAHPELCPFDLPFDLSRVKESPLSWRASHEWGAPAPPEDHPLDSYRGDIWRVDLRPDALLPDVIVANPQPAGLLDFLEGKLPALHDQVFFTNPWTWKSATGRTSGWRQRLGAAGYFDRMQDPIHRRAPGDGWCFPRRAPAVISQTSDSFDASGIGDLVVRGSVEATALMISHRANQLAPDFLRSEGWIKVEPTAPAEWAESKPRLRVRLVCSVDADRQAERSTVLEHLSDGLARWVSLCIRLAVADLESSQWEIPTPADLREPDATVHASNLLDRGSALSSNEFDPSAFIPQQLGRGVGNFTLGVDRSWYLFAAMQEPRRLREVIDEQLSWKSILILIDEPEVHLHLTAQRSVRDWIQEVANDRYRCVDPLWEELTKSGNRPSRSAIVATHAPVFLNYPANASSTTLVFAEMAEEPRDPTRLEESSDPEHDNIPVTDKVQKVRSILVPLPEDADLFDYFKGSLGDQLGISGVNAMEIYRGFIIVEGPHDEEVIERFFGPQLREHKIGLLRAWGTNNIGGSQRSGDRSFALYELDLLTLMGLPLAILVDRATLGPTEKAAVDAFVRSCKKRRLRYWPDRGQPGGHPYPDIIAALPNEAVRSAFPRSSFDGWDPIVDEFEQLRRSHTTTGNFKDFALQRMGLSIEPNYPNFLKPVLDECGEASRPREGLELVMNEIISFLNSPTGISESEDPDYF